MEAQLFVELQFGLACVIISMLMWIVFRTQKQNQEFRLRLGIIEKDLQDVFEDQDVRKGEKEVTESQTERTLAIISDRFEKLEESVTNATKTIELLSNRFEEMEGSIQGTSKTIELLSSQFEKMDESIQGTSQDLESLKKITLEISGNAKKMEELIENGSTESQSFEEALQKIRQEIQELDKKTTTVPLHRYFNEQSFFYTNTTNFSELGHERSGFGTKGWLV